MQEKHWTLVTRQVRKGTRAFDLTRLFSTGTAQWLTCSDHVPSAVWPPVLGACWPSLSSDFLASLLWGSSLQKLAGPSSGN